MTFKELVRPLPGVRTLSILRQRVRYGTSASFWERNYARGETSGPGSYGVLAEGKASFLNSFVREKDIQSVTEFGCGDGHQLSLADYPRYVGLDVSRTAIELCQRKFSQDKDKSFFLYDCTRFVDRAGIFGGDLALSLDVVYHLTEDQIFELYMSHLFDAGGRFVVIYSTNLEIPNTAPHVRHRRFTDWVEASCPQWHLAEMRQGPGIGPGRADFYVYARREHEGN